MNILILYIEVMPYNLPVFEELVKNGYSVKVVQLDKYKITPYTPADTSGVEIVNLSTFKSYTDFANYCMACEPVLIKVCEVKELWYWRIAYTFHKRNKRLPIVLGSDAQWKGSRNNWMKKIFFRITYKQCYTHVLAAGLWQCLYALKIGFRREQLLTPYVSAHNELFLQVNIQHKEKKYPRRFIFTGRLVEIKGIKILLEAWKTITDKKEWKLTIIGSGNLESLIQHYEDIELKQFLSQSEIGKIMEDSGCALVPSLYEPWGLVLHEAAAAGLPVIATRNCGAAYQFVVNKYNGYLIDEGDVASLRDAMLKIINSSDDDLLRMAINSRLISFKITSVDVANALISVI